MLLSRDQLNIELIRVEIKGEGSSVDFHETGGHQDQASHQRQLAHP